MSKKNVFKKYRLLCGTETIQKGDQSYNPRTRGWRNASVGIGKLVSNYHPYLRIRRPVSTATVAISGAPVAAAEFHYLKAGERIQEGDEWNEWGNDKVDFKNVEGNFMWLIGQKLLICNEGRCRRKIKVVEPGTGYRLVLAGEKLQTGDEFTTTGRGYWTTTMDEGVTLNSDCPRTYRREVEAKVEPPKYRFLEPGEIVQLDDEYSSNWNKASFANGIITVARTGKFRRLVK